LRPRDHAGRARLPGEGLKLRFEHGDRVRLIVASCLTVAALPFLLNEGTAQRAERPPTVAAVAPGGEALASPLGDEEHSTVAADTAAPSAEDPSFLFSAATDPTTAPAIVVAVPTSTSPTSASGRASFRRWAEGSTSVSAPCAAWFLDLGTAVTVTNLDNGHTVECVISDRTGVPEDLVIVLDSAVFEQLADLVEAPIPVTISWQ
jgi:hypothetical protein